MKKRIFTIILLMATCWFAQAQSPYQKDFLAFWTTVENNFAYFDTQKIDWKQVKEYYQPTFDTISSKKSFIKELEKVINEFHNGHISLATNLKTSNRIIPTGTDIWAIRKAENLYYIQDLRPHHKAQKSGLKVGMQLLKFNDLPIEAQLKKFLPISISHHTPEMYEYALNMLLAGTHHQERKITVLDKGQEIHFFPDTLLMEESSSLLTISIFPNQIGYIKINNSLGNYDLIKVFDAAMDSLSNTKGLILDLSETPSGGNTTIGRALMGHFTKQEVPYQKHSIPAEEKEFGVKRSWIEYVSPRQKIYTKPLVVLAGHWTGSMGEGITIGLDGMKRAKVVGTPMAKLIGAIYTFTLSETQISYSLPCEKLFHIDGTPRENCMPTILTESTEKALSKALELLNK